MRLGERAFEIILARKAAAGEVETAWFSHHRSKPITEIPSQWPGWYRDLVQRRIDLIKSDRDVALVERPEHKRQWAAWTVGEVGGAGSPRVAAGPSGGSPPVVRGFG